MHQSKMEHFQFADTKRQELFCSHPAGGGIEMLLLFFINFHKLSVFRCEVSSVSHQSRDITD